MRITASFFGCVCRRLATTPPDALVNSIINQKVHRSMPTACAWGKNNEVRAMDAYKLNMQEVGHSGLEIRQSGLVINTECAFLGASPDGIVYDPVSEDPNGLLEIKCPYTYRDVNPQEAAQQKNILLHFRESLSASKNTASLLLPSARADGNMQTEMV